MLVFEGLYYFMAKLRSVSTYFWSDPFIEELNSLEKLLFLYLITNDKTNMLGIYESTEKKIAFETGIEITKVKAILLKFESASKIKRVGNYFVLINFMKNQNYNLNMKKSAIDFYNTLPNHLKISNIQIEKVNVMEGFETVRKALGTVSNHYGTVRKEEVEVKVEYESKLEVEVEVESKKEVLFEIYPTFNDFWDLYDKKVDRELSQKKWEKLTQAEKEKTIIHIEHYKQLQPDSKYRKNPSTYLNQKTFNDPIEPISQNSTKQSNSKNGTWIDFAREVIHDRQINSGGEPPNKDQTI